MINTAYFMAVLLIFLRMSTFFLVVPVFFPKGTPNVLKLALAGITAFILVPGIKTANALNITSNYTLIIFCANEIINGLTLGYITNLCFSFIQMAGQLIDNQIGFSMISMFDPNSNSNVTLLERLLYWISLVLFFLVNGHHMLIRSLIASFDAVGVGHSIIGQNTIMLIIKDFTQYFAIGLSIAIPIVLIVIITDITLGLIARTVPQLNVMILGLPIKILVGLACFTLALPFISDSIVHVFNLLPETFKGIFHSAPLMFVLASGEKTEDATPKKKKEARKKGQVPKSKEVPLAFTLLASTLVLATLGGYVGNNLVASTQYFLSVNMTQEFTYEGILKILSIIMLRSAMIILPILLPIMFMGVLANFAQTGVMFTGEPLVPKFSKLNPISGFKKIFSMRTVVETIKDLAVVTVVGFMGYSYLKGNYSRIMAMGNLKLSVIPASFKDVTIGIFFRITLVMVVIAIIDYIYQRYSYNKDLRMTKQEIKEEYKQEEGDPQIKSKIRQKQREMSMRRMMQSVPEATVVVTNPTHLAIALKYKEGDEAPMVCAKGSGFIAIKIKEIAKAHDVPIIENKPLARLIFNEVEVEAPIPVTMYQAVAEILAVIYKMKKKRY